MLEFNSWSCYSGTLQRMLFICSILNLLIALKINIVKFKLTTKQLTKFLLKRVLIYSILAICLFIANKEANLRLTDYQKNALEIPRGGIVFVDQSSDSAAANGSIEHPFIEITKALNFASKNPAFKIVHISKGVYRENLSLPKNIILAGELDNTGAPLALIQSANAGSGRVVTANTNTKLFGLSIENGEYNLYIPQDKTDVLLSNCIIAKASKWGIFNEEHSSNAPTLRIIKTTVTENQRQGAYLKRSSVVIENSFFTKNGEEGIDLHSEMNTYINNVEVRENGEGGLETEIGDINLVIENSNFTGNKSSGINLQTFEANSSVEIRNNLIASNSDFGIRCALHAPIKSPYFSKMVQISSDNTFDKNGKVSIDPNCNKR